MVKGFSLIRRKKEKRPKVLDTVQPADALPVPGTSGISQPVILPHNPVATSDPSLSSSARQHSRTNAGAEEMEVPLNDSGSCVPATTGRAGAGDQWNRSVTQATTGMAHLQIQEARRGSSLNELLNEAHGMGGGFTAGIVAGTINDYGSMVTRVQQGPARSTTVGMIANQVNHHPGSKQIEVITPAIGPGPKGFAAGTVAQEVNRWGTSYSGVGEPGDLPNFGTGTNPNDNMGEPKVFPENPSLPEGQTENYPSEMTGLSQLPTTQHNSTGGSIMGSEVGPGMIAMLLEANPEIKLINSCVANLTSENGQVDVMEQAPTGECHVNNFRGTFTEQPGAIHRSILLPGEDPHYSGKSVNMVANTVVNKGIGISVVGGERARRIAEEYAMKDLARQQAKPN